MGSQLTRAIVLVSLLTAPAGPAIAIVELRAQSVTVSNTGDVGRICVSMNSGGEQVAGTQSG